MPYKDPAEQRAYNAAYLAANREKNRVRSAAYHAAHKEEMNARNRAYSAAHKEEQRAHNVAYYAAHKEDLAARSRAYYAENREKKLMQNAAYQAAHLPEFAARASIRRAKVRGSTIGDQAEIAEMYRKAKEDPKVRCYICNKMIPMGDRHVDHIFPVSKGFPTRPSNLAIACSHCNLSKGAKHPNELGMLI